jgi:3-phosphoglycerate kinase
MAHLGRPEGRDQSLSLERVGERLAKLIQQPVIFVEDCVGDKVVQAVKKAPAKSVILLENLRFHPEEEADDEGFAQRIAKDSGARYFVQDGFGVVHRAHASTHAITLLLPSVSGLLLEKEYVSIMGAMKHPKRPLVAVLGGAKISDKISVVDEFVSVADTVIIGGAMANTFLARQGHDMGASLLEEDQFPVVDKVLKDVKDKPADFLLLPTDVAVATDIEKTAPRKVIGLDGLSKKDKALDLGDKTIEAMVEKVEQAGTVIWSGTLGYAELPQFAHASARLALTLATHPNTTSVIGGGDTTDFVLGWEGQGGKSFSLVSTGGSASLELMAGEKLPGIESLLDAPK